MLTSCIPITTVRNTMIAPMLTRITLCTAGKVAYDFAIEMEHERVAQCLRATEAAFADARGGDA